MNVLVIAARDSANFALVKIVKELERRGHKVYVYDKSLDTVNIRMFKKNDIKVHYFAQITDEVIDRCDVMFCHTTYVGDNRIRKKLYTFFFNHIFVYGHENNSDFVFTQCDDPYNTFPNKVVMKVGSPKFDSEHKNNIPAKDSRMILFIETGHFPFGKEGRLQVAKLILDICRKCPDYTVTVKPRFLPGDTKKLTRRNTDHIYQYIYELCQNSIPANLNLLYEHLALDELIYQSHSIVCYSSSAYLEASLSKRGVLYVDGIKSFDAIGDRQNKYWKAFNEFIADTNIVVPYGDALSYLPDGIVCSDMHLDKALYSKDNIAPKIVNVMEHIWENYLSRGLYPKIGSYEYDTYIDCMEPDFNITKKELVNNNKYDILVYDCQKVFQSIGANLSFNKIYEVIDEWKGNQKLANSTINELREELANKINKHIVYNADLLLENKIDQAILIKAYYELYQYERIENMKTLYLLAEDAYCFYMGKLYCDKNKSDGLLLIDTYFQYVKATTYEECEIYYPKSLLEAFLSAFLYCARNSKEEEQRYIDIMEELSAKYKYDVFNYDIRCLRVCYRERFYEEVLLLANNWLNRNKDGIQPYRQLELNAEAYMYIAKIYKSKGQADKSQEYFLRSSQEELKKTLMG